MANAGLNDKDRGLYYKFTVWRVDGRSDVGKTHEHCQYFPLDLTHDPHAVAALRAYAESCRQTHPLLAFDLDAKVTELERKWKGSS